MSDDVTPWTLLHGIAALTSSPLSRIALMLRSAVFPLLNHRALIVFTEDCTGRPQKKAGDEEIISRVSFDELEAIRTRVTGEESWLGEAELGGVQRPILALLHPSSGALLVLAEPSSAHDELDLVRYLWRLTAERIREKVADAPPSYLLESRAASAERIRITTELTDLHSTTLETVLATLRSPSLEDGSARSAATEITAKALIELRTLTDRTTDRAEEPVAKAFERLREDMRPLTRLKNVNIEFVEPPENGRALPGEVAHAARAIVRGMVLAMMEQSDLTRIRTQWGCDGDNLLIALRDDGRGALALNAATLSRLERQVEALSGEMRIDITQGWGANVSITLPLDPPAALPGDSTAWHLAPRELDVLQLLAAGKSNRAIAAALTISENTVKFHVRNLFRKMGVTSRAGAIALANLHQLH